MAEMATAANPCMLRPPAANTGHGLPAGGLARYVCPWKRTGTGTEWSKSRRQHRRFPLPAGFLTINFFKIMGSFRKGIQGGFSGKVGNVVGAHWRGIDYMRISADLPHLGLTYFKGETPTLQETQVAKNYLNEEELNVLNRMVTAYLELAELQALNRKPMYMKDWIPRLDDFVRMTGNEVLTHAGTVSLEQAVEKAEAEYAKYKEKNLNDLSKAEKDFMKFIDQTAKQLGNKKKK